MSQKRGAPVGNTNATKNKPVRDALRKLAVQGATDEEVAKAIYEKAKAGDMVAAKLYVEMRDGLADQKVNVSHTVEHLGLSETGQFVADALGAGTDGALPKPLPH